MAKLKLILLTFTILLTLSVFIGLSSAVTPTCTDTDGGIKLTTKGTVSGVFSSGQPYSFADRCGTDSKHVLEGYCINPDTGDMGGTHPVSIIKDCASSSVCSDGVCVSNNPSCASVGGTCRDVCSYGEYIIQSSGCSKESDLCCKPGEIMPCPPGTEEWYCSKDNPTKRFKCINGNPISEDCGKNALGHQFYCEDGACVYSDIPKCKSCDAFALSYFVGSFWKEKQCSAKILAIPPQSTTTCFLSLIKIAVIPVIFIFSFLFLFDFTRKYSPLKKNKILRAILSLIISLIVGYLVYAIFFVGVILFILIMLAKSYIGKFR
jgi:hypothetical protein